MLGCHSNTTYLLRCQAFGKCSCHLSCCPCNIQLRK